MQKYLEIVKKLSLEEKAKLLTGTGINTTPLEEHGIGTIQMSDATSGVRCPWKEPMENCDDVAFPSETAMAATFNRDIVKKMAAGIADNCIAHGIDMLLAPAINLHRNPLCGRIWEYFSEDPYLTGEMATEYINGVQGQGVGTCLKHFAMNTQEHYRMHINSECDERTIRELYLAGFETAVKNSKPTSLMCAYNKVNGIFASENKWLLTDVLRNEWGYEGAVVSDWGAVHNSAKTIAAGLDLIMPDCQDRILNDIKLGLEKGWCTMDDVDLAAARVLRLTDKTLNLKRTDKEFVREEYHELAYEGAAESMTLLQNDENFLPVDPKRVKKLVVLGKYAEEILAIQGEPTAPDGRYMSGSVTISEKSIENALPHIRKYCDDLGIEMTYEPLYEFDRGSISPQNVRAVMIDTIKDADLVLFFIGMPPAYEEEGSDRQELSFPYYLSRLATDCCRFNPNTVIIQQSGCAVSPYFFLKPPKGILQAWMPGEAGGRAIADAIFGKINPSGKLPMTFMKKLDPRLDTMGDGRKIFYTEGLEIGYRYYDKHPEDIWFPFGHGLSYTTFEYSNLKITPEKIENADIDVTVNVDITNTGKVKGKEVVQVYVAQDDPSVVRPIKEFKGFEKVELEPGETKTVTIKLNSNSFAYYNVCLHKWYVEPDTYHIMVGASSQDIRLTADFVYDEENGYTMLREEWGNESQVVMA